MKQAVNHDRVPASLSRAAKATRDGMRHATRSHRALPDWMILGAHKAGTTSLWDWLALHPQVVPSWLKEVHYFDNDYDGDHRTYRMAFPARQRMEQVRRSRGKAVTGEATPYYLSSPHIPRLVRAMVPDAKLVALLRNPVDRAFSAFHHNRRRTPWEPLQTFEEAVERELTDLVGERDRVVADPSYDFRTYAHHCYLHRGIYVDQLQWWEAAFPPEQLLVVQSEDLFGDPHSTYETVLDFLGLDPWTPASFGASNANTYEPVEPATRARLVEWFEPHNQRLYAHLGRDLGWQ